MLFKFKWVWHIGSQRNILLCICGNSIKNEMHIMYNNVVMIVLAESVVFALKVLPGIRIERVKHMLQVPVLDPCFFFCE